MNSLAYGQAMAAAARDYKKEVVETERLAKEKMKVDQVDLGDLENDPELEKLHRDRLENMKREVEKRQEMSRKGHGSLNEVQEQEFLVEVTTTELVVCHFYHHEFERCRILDKHLGVIASKYFETKFIKIHAPDAPFFVHKLDVQVLPCVIMFRNGIAFDRVVGFEELRGRDDFKTSILENRLMLAGVLKIKSKNEDDSDDENDQTGENRRIRVGGGFIGLTHKMHSDDEDSDFD
eukprot:CAMPEP_0196571340 /NCGR_PEP_ID=MMETSP1081-20130531/1518_1 /TAXON_ID=36882 /ORGANISM="Pyramimonas amylifera, Strain CCMP720" /LENGTH=234 /DNA_ID=CAMNT_0041888241 /DNA_START=120 /DNA_END=824 /DNA_ORIENTATION=+